MLDFDNTERKPLRIKTRTDDGELHEHTFEVLPMNRARYEETLRFARRGAEAEDDPDADQAKLLAGFCDLHVRSTNGPVTITSLWDDGVIPLVWLKQISEALAQEAIGSPPA